MTSIIYITSGNHHVNIMKENKRITMRVFFLLLIFFNSAYGQNKLFKYDFKYKSNPKDSAVLRKMILDCEDGKRSVFRSERERTSDSLIAVTGLGNGRNIRLEDQFYIVKDYAENIMYKSIQNIYRDIFSIQITEKLEWEILSEKSKIENFEVQKAKVSYGGRNWTAWFTTEIPIQDGPYVFRGLPGLVIRISDNQNDYNFNLTEIKNGSEKIYYRNKGLELNWEQFKKIASDYYSDPLARIKSTGMPFKVNDGMGNAIPADMRKETDNIKKDIRENNNPIELNHKIKYE